MSETAEYIPVTKDDLVETMEWLAAIRDEMPISSVKRAQIAATGLTIERLQYENLSLRAHRDSLVEALTMIADNTGTAGKYSEGFQFVHRAASAAIGDLRKVEGSK